MPIIKNVLIYLLFIKAANYQKQKQNHFEWNIFKHLFIYSLILTNLSPNLHSNIIKNQKYQKINCKLSENKCKYFPN